MYHERGIRQVDIAETLHLRRRGFRGCSSELPSWASFGLLSRSPREAPEVEEALEGKYGVAEAVVTRRRKRSRRHRGARSQVPRTWKRR